MMKSYSLKVGGQSFTARIVEYTETKVVVDLDGNQYEVELSAETLEAEPSMPVPAGTPKKQPAPVTPPSRSSSPIVATGAGAVVAPLPGVVKQILVAVGDDVGEGTVVLVLEAMKMENEISARAAGKVSEIAVGLGESVQEGQLLLQIEVS